MNTKKEGFYFATMVYTGDFYTEEEHEEMEKKAIDRKRELEKKK